eukprot:1288517-Amphidinium_carterae.1
MSKCWTCVELSHLQCRASFAMPSFPEGLKSHLQQLLRPGMDEIVMQLEGPKPTKKDIDRRSGEDVGICCQTHTFPRFPDSLWKCTVFRLVGRTRSNILFVPID